jgi:hypothetical protein
MSKMVMTATLAVAMVMTVGCGDDSSDDTGGAGGAGGAAGSGGTGGGNFTRGTYEDVSAILGGPEQMSIGSCAASSCHGGSRAQAELDFKAPMDLTEVLVNVPSCENPAMDRVEPGDPENSWLWIKLTGEVQDTNSGLLSYDVGTPAACTGVTTGYGTRMPQVGGFDTLSDEKLFKIRTWIEDGAPGPN